MLELNATAGGVATLERQRDNYRAVLEGAEYQNLDAMGTQRPADSRRVGEMAKQCVLDLQALRDELLAALEEVVAISDRKHDAWDRARAAIAKAKGPSEPPVTLDDLIKLGQTRLQPTHIWARKILDAREARQKPEGGEQ